MVDPGGKMRLEPAFEILKAEVEAARPPGDLYPRLSARLDESAAVARSPWRIGLTVAAVAVLVAAGFIATWLLRAKTAASFAVVAASTDYRSTSRPDGTLVVQTGSASLRVAELATRIDVVQFTAIRREHRGVRVLNGTAVFDVAARQPGRELSVYVSGGRIDVVGTQFTVVQRADGGTVRVGTGLVRFVDAQRVETLLHPGESLPWGTPPSASAPDKPAAAPPTHPRTASQPQAPQARARSGPTAAAPPVKRLEVSRQAERRLLAEIDGLRMRHEFDLLAERLRDILASEVEEPLRERLSFELCDVLTHHGPGIPAACDQITRHLQRYPAGRYGAPLRGFQQTLACEP